MGYIILETILNAFHEIFRGAHNVTTFIGKGVERITPRYLSFLLFIHDGVLKLYACPPHIVYFCFNDEDIIIPCRRNVMAVHLRKGQVVTLGLNIGIDNAHISKTFGSPDFKPFYIIGMIYNAHGIRICIGNPDSDFTLFQQKPSSLSKSDR